MFVYVPRFTYVRPNGLCKVSVHKSVVKFYILTSERYRFATTEKGKNFVASRATINNKFQEIDNRAAAILPIVPSHYDGAPVDCHGAKVPVAPLIQALVLAADAFVSNNALAHDTKPDRLIWIAGHEKGKSLSRDWTKRDGHVLRIVVSGDSHNPSGHMPYTSIKVRLGSTTLSRLHQKPQYYYTVCEFRGKQQLEHKYLLYF